MEVTDQGWKNLNGFSRKQVLSECKRKCFHSTVAAITQYCFSLEVSWL